MSDNHPSIVARNRLLEIADTWPALTARLRPGSSADRSGVHVAPSSRPPIDVHVSDVVAEVTEWAHFLAHVLMDETDWRPDDTSMPALARGLAERVGHFTEHPDEQLALAFTDDAKRLAHLVRSTALPTGRRTVRVGLRCEMHDTSPLGERVACTGWYTLVLDPDKPGYIPDLVCTQDGQHRITPDEWQRAYRRTAMRPEAAAALIARLRDARVEGSRA